MKMRLDVPTEYVENLGYRDCSVKILNLIIYWKKISAGVSYPVEILFSFHGCNLVFNLSYRLYRKEDTQFFRDAKYFKNDI